MYGHVLWEGGGVTGEAGWAKNRTNQDKMNDMQSDRSKKDNDVKRCVMLT